MAAQSILRVLLVDESAEFLEGAALWMLEHPEMIIVGRAQTGPDAVVETARLRPDLVILDGVLPGIDGFRVTRMLKARPDPPLVVIATFATSSAARDEALAAGADGFIAKDEFAGGLERFLEEVGRKRGARKRPTTPETRAPLGSQNEPDL